MFYADRGRLAGVLAVGRPDDLELARTLLRSGDDVDALRCAARAFSQHAAG